MSALEELERIYQTPAALNARDRHEYLYRNVVVMEFDMPQPQDLARLLLLKARILSEMESNVYSDVIGQRRTGHQAVEDALVVADQARTIAQPLHDDALEGRLQLFRGQLLRRVDNIPASANAYREATVLLERAVAKEGAVDPTLTHDLFEATTKLASTEFILAQLPAARVSLEHAQQLDRKLRSMGQGNFIDHGIISWLEALLTRAEGDLVAALSAVTQAADEYLSKKESFSKVRLLNLAAEIALDLAEAAPPPLEAHLEAAERYMKLTEEHARLMLDPAGVEMARLSEARLRQLRSPATPVAVTRARKVLERVYKERAWDILLLVDAHTTLGRLLAARGETVAAQQEFKVAMDLAEEHGTPGHAWYAKRHQ